MSLDYQKLRNSPKFLKSDNDCYFTSLDSHSWFFQYEESPSSVQFISVQSLSRVQLFATPWITARQASLFITISRSSLRLMSIESVMPSSHLILCHPLLPLPPIPPSIRVFSNESTLRMRWPKYWSFSFSIIPSKGKHKRTRNLREEKMQGEPARNTHGFVSRWSYILSMGNENWNWEYELSHCSCHPRNLSHISLGENKGSEIAMECRKTEKRERERMRLRECQQKETREVKK